MWVGCAAAGARIGGPQLGLQLSGAGVDLLKLLSITGHIEQNALVEVFPQQRADRCRNGVRQQIGPEVFRPDGVGLGLLVVLALVVAAGGHRKAEADNQPEQRQRGGQDKAEIFA